MMEGSIVCSELLVTQRVPQPYGCRFHDLMVPDPRATRQQRTSYAACGSGVDLPWASAKAAAKPGMLRSIMGSVAVRQMRR